MGPEYRVQHGGEGLSKMRVLNGIEALRGNQVLSAATKLTRVRILSGV